MGFSLALILVLISCVNILDYLREGLPSVIVVLSAPSLTVHGPKLRPLSLKDSNIHLDFYSHLSLDSSSSLGKSVTDMFSCCPTYMTLALNSHFIISSEDCLTCSGYRHSYPMMWPLGTSQRPKSMLTVECLSTRVENWPFDLKSKTRGLQLDCALALVTRAASCLEGLEEVAHALDDGGREEPRLTVLDPTLPLQLRLQRKSEHGRDEKGCLS